jgi:hypothetical protein
MTLCELIHDDDRGSTPPHHAWKVEYSSKPEGVGNFGAGNQDL